MTLFFFATVVGELEPFIIGDVSADDERLGRQLAVLDFNQDGKLLL